MFWSAEENAKIAKLEYVALAVDFNMNVEKYLYEYDYHQSNMYRISYNPKESSNRLHRLLKFQVQKRFVVIEKDDDMLNIVGHYDEIDLVKNNQVVVDLQTTIFADIKV